MTDANVFEGVDEEALTAAFAAEVSEPEPETPDVAEEPEPDAPEPDVEEEEEEPAPGEQPPVTPEQVAEFVEWKGNRLNAEQMDALLSMGAQWQKWASQATQAQINQYVEWFETGQLPGQTPAPAPEAEAEFDALDPDQLRSYIDSRVEERVAPYQRDIQEREWNRVRGEVDEGSKKFRAQFEVSDEEYQRLVGEATRLGIVASLSRAGVPGAEAAYRALETAFYVDPDLRQRAVDKALTQVQKDEVRQRRLSAHASSPGSTSRSKPAPKTRAESERAMLDELQEALSDGSFNNLTG